MANAAIEKRESKANVPERMEQATYYTPLVDIIEKDDAFIFQADLPGVNASDLDISFENGVLTIDGKVQPRQPESQEFIWQEYGVGHFHRSFNIDTPVNVDGIRGELKNGELMLTVSKTEAAKIRKIQIQTA